MRLSSPSSGKAEASPSTSPGSRLLQKLKSIPHGNKATASGDAKTSPVATAPVVTPASSSEPVIAQQPTTTTTSSSSSSSSSSSTEGVSVPPPAPAVESAPVVSAAPAAPATAPASETSAAAPASQGSAWQCYREARLSKVVKFLQIFLVALLLVLVYCGDLAPAASRTTAVLSTHTATVKELLLTPLQKDWGVTKAWNTVSDSMPAPVALLTPMSSPALARGESVLYSGDYIYSCLPVKGEMACAPTFFHLKDDGTLVLARGSTPSKPHTALWSSKTPQPKACKKCGPTCACKQKHKYRAVFTEKGALEVWRVGGDGKRVYKKRFFMPRVLRPWPLGK